MVAKNYAIVDFLKAYMPALRVQDWEQDFLASVTTILKSWARSECMYREYAAKPYEHCNPIHEYLVYDTGRNLHLEMNYTS